jgi:hypothetical protein
MAKRQLQDAEGNWIEVDDDVSLIGPAPQDQPQQSTRDTRYQPIKYDYRGGPAKPLKPHDPHTLGPQPQPRSDEPHAGNSGINDPAFIKLWEDKNKGTV